MIILFLLVHLCLQQRYAGFVRLLGTVIDVLFSLICCAAMMFRWRSAMQLGLLLLVLLLLPALWLLLQAVNAVLPAPYMVCTGMWLLLLVVVVVVAMAAAYLPRHYTGRIVSPQPNSRILSGAVA